MLWGCALIRRRGVHEGVGRLVIVAMKSSTPIPGTSAKAEPLGASYRFAVLRRRHGVSWMCVLAKKDGRLWNSVPW